VETNLTRKILNNTYPLMVVTKLLITPKFKK